MIWSILGLLGFKQIKPESCFIFFIQILAYVCGSIIRGHFSVLETKMALSVDKLSPGNPLSCHSLIVKSSQTTSLNLKRSLT